MKKSILVYYINVGTLTGSEEIDNYVEAEKLKLQVPDEVKFSTGIVHEIFLPTRIDNSRIEIIYLS